MKNEHERVLDGPCFLPLLSEAIHSLVTDAISGAGYQALSRKDWPLVVPALVVIDTNTRKEDFLKAGFWRGYGVPVVIIGRTGNERVKLAKTMGAYSFLDAADFIRWFATGPAYLTTKATARAAEALEQARSLAQQGLALES